jgi:hypothetical protein
VADAESIAAIYVDEDAPVELARALQTIGLHAVATEQAGNKGLRDAEQLAYAWQAGMIFVTCNFKDFALLHEAWSLWPGTWGVASDALAHQGILVIPNGSRAQAPQMAVLIQQFFDSGQRPRNRFFRWRPTTGWREGTR